LQSRRHAVIHAVPVRYSTEHVRNRTDVAERRRNHRSQSPERSARDSTMQSGEFLVNFLIWLIVGGVIGWLASIMMKTNDQQGIILNVVVGIIGAMLAGWFLSPLFGVGTINQDNFSLPAMLVSFVGAAILLAIVNLVRRGSMR
jgi:uncharacterized membrane protein YeaQ/YmgE (transglycosylase-associated protein family)